MKWRQFLTPVDSMGPDEARTYMSEHDEGSYTLLDVRQPGEYEKERIPGATLLPLPEISDRLGEVDPRKPVIVYCAVGGRSRAAAQLLAGQGFETVYNLKGGIRGWHGLKAAGPAETGLAAVSGRETPAQVLVLAYGMEEGLRGFYREMAARIEDQETSDLFARLAEIEDTHKDRLFAQWKGLEQEGRDRQAFEAQVVAGVMEGGVTSREFLDRNPWAMESLANALTLAMTIETQSLDLYLRYAGRMENASTKRVLQEIAEEEKRHLAYLGKHMERRG